MSHATGGSPVAPPTPIPQGMAVLDLTLDRGAPGTRFIVHVNGHRVEAVRGRQQIVAPAGPTRVDVAVPWRFTTIGDAALEFTSVPGATVPVFYAAPWIISSGGAIGHEPQRSRGLGFAIALLSVFGVIVLWGLGAAAMTLLSTVIGS